MSWYAIDAIDDALDATKAFLFPFSLGRWARLALITLFLGAGGAGVQTVFRFTFNGLRLAGSGFEPGPSTGGSSTIATVVNSVRPPDPETLAQVNQPIPSELGFAVGMVALIVIGAFILLALLFAVLSPVFEFVFVHVIATDDVRIRGPFKRQFWNGMRLLVFQIGLFILFAIPVVAVAAAVVFLFQAVPDLGIVVVLGLIFLFILWVLLFAVVSGFTTQFVVPVAYVDDSGIIAGWSEVWSLLTAEKKQTLVYLLMHLLVGIGVGIVRFLLTLAGLIPVAIVAIIVGVVAGAVVSGTVAPGLGIGVGVIAGFLVGLLLYFFFVALPLNVLTQTYLRTYELASLAGFDSRYDLVDQYRDDDGDTGDVYEHGGDDDNGEDGFDEFVPADDIVDEEESGDDGRNTSGRDTGTTPVF